MPSKISDQPWERWVGEDNQIQHIDLGMVHSSAASSMVDLILSRLRQDGIIEDSISPSFLVRHWSPAFREWSTRSVRDTIFASPQFPRLLDAESIKGTISRGVSGKIIAYVGNSVDGGYEPFYYGKEIPANEIELSDDMFVITGEEAEKHIKPPVLSVLTSLVISPPEGHVEPVNKTRFTVKGFDQHNHEIASDDVKWVAAGGTIDANGVFLAGQDEGRFVVTANVGEIEGSAEVIISKSPPPPTPGAKKLSWCGEIPSQKWMNFYTKVLSGFASGKGLKLVLSMEAAPEGGVSDQKIEEVKIALRGLGLNDNVSAE